MFNFNLEKMITYVVCHEFGHAKQARIFEDNQVFPWYILGDRRCHIEIDGVKIQVKFEDIDFINNRLQDYCVDKELHKYNISNISAKLSVRNLQLPLQASEGVVSYVRMRSLPVNITFYEFGELSDSEKENIKTIIKYSIGEKWDTAYNMMKSLEFTNVGVYKNVLRTLIDKIFEQNAYFSPMISELIFKGRERPSFWNKNEYHILLINPKFFI